MPIKRDEFGTTGNELPRSPFDNVLVKMFSTSCLSSSKLSWRVRVPLRTDLSSKMEELLTSTLPGLSAKKRIC